MATASGFTNAYNYHGNSAHGIMIERTVAPGYNTILAKGDPVSYATDGSVKRAASGDNVIGIFKGASYTDATTGKPTFTRFLAAGTTAKGSVPIKVLIERADANVFRAVLDAAWNDNLRGKNTTFTAADGNAFSNSAFLITATGATAAATGKDVRIIDRVSLPGNDTDPNPIVNVTFIRTPLVQI